MSENLRGGIFFDSHCIYYIEKKLKKTIKDNINDDDDDDDDDIKQFCFTVTCVQWRLLCVNDG